MDEEIIEIVMKTKQKQKPSCPFCGIKAISAWCHNGEPWFVCGYSKGWSECRAAPVNRRRLQIEAEHG